MRIAIHDFPGHPFQVELSRELARRGHDVQHSFCDQYVGGKGDLSVNESDPSTLEISAVSGSLRFAKYSPAKRILFEIAYAHDLVKKLKSFVPDFVVLCNVPLVTNYLISRWFGVRRIKWLLWHQDIYSMGMSDEVERKLPRTIAHPIGKVFSRLERNYVRQADAVVAIDDIFLEKYHDWGISPSSLAIIPNWAPLSKVTPRPLDNPWVQSHGLPTSGLRLLYGGTLGRKHNPHLLLELTRELAARGNQVHLTVVSEGDGADELRTALRPDDPVTVLDFQPAECFSDVLASAEVALVLLEPEASRFSIPSKVTSYLAAGRTIAGMMPANNSAAKAIAQVGGKTVPPDEKGIVDLAEWLDQLNSDSARMQELGQRARAHAECEFDVAAITTRFEKLLAQCHSEHIP